MTRAKAAALEADVNAQPAKQPLQSKKTAINANPTAQGKRRAALGDVSNVGKGEVVEGKKPLGTKGGLVSKASQPTGVQKTTRTTSTRTALASKETKKTEVKRTGSGSGAIGASQKRKATSTAQATKQEVLPEEGEPRRKKVHTSEIEKKHERTQSRIPKPESKLENIPAKENLVEPEPEPEVEPEPETVETGP